LKAKTGYNPKRFYFKYYSENNTKNDAKKKIKMRQVVEKKEDKIVKTEEEMEEEIRNRTESATDEISRKPIELDISDESR